MAPRETANNAYAKFWDDKQKVLWCVVVFSGVVNKGLCNNYLEGGGVLRLIGGA